MRVEPDPRHVGGPWYRDQYGNYWKDYGPGVVPVNLTQAEKDELERSLIRRSLE